MISFASFATVSTLDTTKINKLLGSVSTLADKRTLSPNSFKHAEEKFRQAEYLSRLSGYTEGQARSWILLSKLYSNLPVNDSVQVYAHRAGRLFKRANLQLMEAKAYLQFASYLKYRFNSIPQAEILCDSALHIFNELLPNSEFAGDALYYKSMIYWSRRDKRQTIVYCKKAIDIYNVAHSPHLSRAYIFLGNIYGGPSGDIQGFSYTYKGLQIAEQYQDTSAAFSGNATIAEFYKIINNKTLWIAYLIKAKSYTSYLNDNNRAMYVSRNLTDAYNDLHQYDKAIQVIEEGLLKGNPKDDEYILMYISAMDTYTLSGNLSKAAKLYARVNEFANKPSPRWLWPLYAHISAARYFIAIHQFEKAREHLKKISLERDREGIVLLKISYEQLSFKVDSAENKLDTAIKHYQTYVALRDSVNDATHDKVVAQLQIKYESAKKDNEISHKNGDIKSLIKQRAFQESALQSQTYARNLSFAAVALLVLLLGLGYNRFKLKQRSNQDLQQQQAVINDQNSALKAILAERDWLLKEVHHRTKNNLQIVISLLNSQLANIKDDAAYQIIKDSQYRMYSISLIHHKLYQSDNLSSVDMELYINELVTYLSDSFNVERTIKFNLKLDKLLIDISQAVPLGLILNEAITNALKYAFSKGREGCVIEIALSHSHPDKIMLAIADNGKGFPEGFNAERSKSLGMSLMIGLCRQLRGQIKFIDNAGIRVELILSKAQLLRTAHQQILSDN